MLTVILIALVYISIHRFPKATLSLQLDYLRAAEVANLVPAENLNNSKQGVLFGNQSQTALLELPELKIIQEDCLSALTTPRVLSTKVLGSIFGQGPELRKDITEYAVLHGDTLKSIAQNFGISLDTLLLANDLSGSSKIKTGQSLVILPVSGVVHIVKQGNTLESIAITYKAKTDEIIDINELANESDIYIGDILVIPDGIMPKKAPVYGQTQLTDNYFIFPTQGEITQILHWYNGVDIGSKCGTPVFAAAAGVVVKTRYGWNGGGGNVVTIKHKDGVISYYGHLMTITVQEGETIDVGQKVGLVGGQPGTDGAGISTGCHLHFTVIGAKNPFGSLPLGYKMKYVGE